MARWLSLQAAGILSAIVAFLVYGNTLKCGIVFDDEPAIKKNQDLRPHTPWSSLLWHDFWGAPMDSSTSHKSYRPLTVATFRLNYLLHELQPMGYHLVNVLLHSAVCYLYVQLCGVVFSAVWPALIAGLLFAVHPIHTEAVAGLVGRTELLSGLFYIAALLCYRCFVLCRKGCGWLVVTLVCSLCSALSKEQGITVVAVCLTYDVFVLHKGNAIKCLSTQGSHTKILTAPLRLLSCTDQMYNFTTKVDFSMDLVSGMELLRSFFVEPHKHPKWIKGFLKRAVALAAFTLVFLVVRVRIMKESPEIFNKTINPAMYLSTPYRQLNWMYLSFVNSWLLLNPSRLSADWRFGAVPLVTILDPHNILTVTNLTAVALLGVFAVKGDEKHRKIMLIGLALTLFPYIPASNLFFPVGFIIAERVLYLPSMGFCLLVGYGAWCVLQRTRNVGLRAVIVLSLLGLLAFHAGRTVLRNDDWKSNLSLYHSGAKFNPHNGVMLTNLGIEHGRLKNFSYAERLYRTSIEVAPTHSKGYANLGGLMEALKRYDEAEWALLKAIEFGAEDNTGSKIVETYAFLIDKVILRNKNRLQDALHLVDKALRDYPTYAQVYSMKGNILLEMNRNEEALQLLEVAVESKLLLPETHSGLGVAYMRLGRKSQAETTFRNVLHNIDPSHVPTMVELGKLLRADRRLQEAEKFLQRAVAMKPRNTDALFSLAEVHSDLKNYEKARELWQKVVLLEPSHQGALSKLRLSSI